MAYTIPRSEYPRPQFERSPWINLNGQWDFAFDDDNEGIKDGWYLEPLFNMKITVPFTYTCRNSGINVKEVHDIIWYSREFALPDDMKGKRIILNFGAVDYKADVWVNGRHVASHAGGHVPFSAEITDVIKEGSNIIVLRAEDMSKDLELPRGKQYWKPTSESIFYTRTTGIWQTVWIEAVPESYLKKVWMTPDIDKKSILVEYEMDGSCKDIKLGIEIKLHCRMLVEDSTEVVNKRGKRTYWLDKEVTEDWNSYESLVWAPENPVLFDIIFKVLQDGDITDEVKSYFALRKSSVQSGKFMLNNRPYYQKMLLDQGYWEESLLTAPTDEAFIDDISICKKMGFNGVRKHQKIEDPRYLYWADKLGFLVWGEMAAAYSYSRKYVKRVTGEWIEMLERDYNHPCIVAWTPLNESWGVEDVMNNKDEQAHSAAMYWLTKSIDQTRPVISNDGWEHTKSDLLTIHDYEWRKDVLSDRYSSMENILNTRHTGRGLFADGWGYDGQPVIVSEVGGISYKKSDWSGWGYSSASSDEDFAKRYYDVVSVMLESPLVQGIVYTQVSDVEQEINGLLTYDRKPKIDPEIIRAINEGRWKPGESL